MLGLGSARPPRGQWFSSGPPDLPKDEDRFSSCSVTRVARPRSSIRIVKVHGLATLEQGSRVVGTWMASRFATCWSTPGSSPPPSPGASPDCALGVHYAHVAGNDDGTPLIHGDLRPETVMLAFSGRAKVGGYGALAVAPKETNGQRVVNRRRYCAPEQIIGGRAAQTAQTDVFLLGLVLYECRTGRMPWDKETDFDQAVMNAPLPRRAAAGRPGLLRERQRRRASERHKTALAFTRRGGPRCSPRERRRSSPRLLEHHPRPRTPARGAGSSAGGGARGARPGVGGAAVEGLRGPHHPHLAARARGAGDSAIRLALEDAPGLRRRGRRRAGGGLLGQTRHAVPRPMLTTPPGARSRRRVRPRR